MNFSLQNAGRGLRRAARNCPGRGAVIGVLLLVLLLAGGCATSPAARMANPRPFNFQTDTFAYANELVWEYFFDANGQWVSKRREPPADYTHHCFVVARSAKQFFLHARFDPSLPPPDDATCRRLIRQVVARSASDASLPEKKIVIPGYASLRAFSEAREALLKAECGGAWQSYVQRGHWRMVFPISRRHQAATAQQLLSPDLGHQPAVVHVVRFPQLSINHALLVFAAQETERSIEFRAYDPNLPEREVTLTYDRATRTFSLPPLRYYAGGRVDVYEVHRGWIF
jgi:hypothetical protein